MRSFAAINALLLAAFIVMLHAGQQLQQQPLQPIATPNTTVIAGAGIIGLASAYHLALANHEKGLGSPIVVLDAQNTTFAAASSTNCGCLIPSELDDRLKELGATPTGYT
jgi:threonine dehydrogenase-like Zn-dependent dehydrogenase